MSLFKNLNLYACGKTSKNASCSIQDTLIGVIRFLYSFFFEEGGKENKERLLKTGTVEERIGREKVEDQ
jgi:hypothetical protein